VSDVDSQPWNVLVVDDDPAMHEATTLCLARKTWRKRPFQIHTATSGREARDLLMNADFQSSLQVAIVDVVMESKLAGLDLCRLIRSDLPRSIRIILRTGQPATAPEERVINDYDIDYYFTKTEATPERLFSAVRACVRISQDMQTLLMFSTQLRSFSSAVQKMASLTEITRLMRTGLDFLEIKHSARITFVADIEGKDEASGALLPEAHGVARAHELGLEQGELHAGGPLGLAPTSFVLHFTVATDDPTGAVMRGGFVVETRSTMHGLYSDLVLFLQNWTVAMSGLFLQLHIARQNAIHEAMQRERIHSLANLVTGLSHKVNTPLGVVNTANVMLQELAEELERASGREAITGLLADVKDTTGLLSRNVKRVNQLIVSFKQLSVTQVNDERVTADLVEVVTECAKAVDRRDEILLKVTSAEKTLPWTGYPRHLTHVITALIHNAVDHAYPQSKGQNGGAIDVRIFREDKMCRVEVEDYGAGIPPEMLPRLFEPFGTAWNNSNEAGLSLAVTHTIVANLLRGGLTCDSVVGRGSKFVVRVPLEVPLIP
jgi:signal transduction histidine kinase